MAPQTEPKKRYAEPAASMVAVYDGQDCIGTIKVGGRGDAVAYNAKGKRLGFFSVRAGGGCSFKKLKAARCH